MESMMAAVELASRESRFLSPEVWKLNSGDPDPAAFEDNSVFGGLDLSSRQDLTALTLVARDGAGVAHLQCHFFAPEQGLRERADRDRVPYNLWRDRGFLTTTPGASVDFEYVAQVLGTGPARLSGFPRQMFSAVLPTIRREPCMDPIPYEQVVII